MRARSTGIGILDLEDRRENFAIDPRNLPHNLRTGSSAALTTVRLAPCSRREAKGNGVRIRHDVVDAW